MKRTLMLFIAILPVVFSAYGQSVTMTKPEQTISTTPGYITINEFTGGIGLGIVNGSFGKSFFGITTIHGYQVDQNFVVAAGTGFLAYNGGNLIPLFMDLRYCFPINPFTPYVLGDGGVLLNPSGGTKLFINPAIGVRYSMNRKIGFNFSTGLFVQKGDNIRDSFINFKLGVTIKLK
jgi:hypothetical protein